MRGAVLYGKDDVRLEELPEPAIVESTDAIVRIAATCVCGSDLWHYRGINPPPKKPSPFGHEYCGVVEAVGADVTTIRPGDFVIGSFFASDGTCPNCRNGFQTFCLHMQPLVGCQAEVVRVPWADGTLVATPEMPSAELIPSLLAASDVLGTGWFAADSAQVAPGMTVAVVGDGAVGLCGVIAAAQLGADRIIAMSRHSARQQLAREFGATDIVEERGDDGVARIKDMTDGIGADAVLECVGTEQSMRQAIASGRPGALVGIVGVPHDVAITGTTLFRSGVGVRGGPAPVRRFLPHLIELIFDGKINPGKVFDLTLPLDDVAEAYAAMDQRRATKVLLQP